MVAQAGPAALSTLLDDALRQLPPSVEHTPASDGFLYSGNRHESVPRALFLDTRLTPLERNAWLTFRSLASSDGTVVLSYDALRGYLPSAPGSKRAALETVSRAVLCLRLSTWIALVEYRRNPMTGFSMASRYAVRNQPLAFDDVGTRHGNIEQKVDKMVFEQVDFVAVLGVSIR